MAVEQVKSASHWKGLSSDTKPTTGGVGSTFTETDTSNVSEWDGDSWQMIKSGGGTSVSDAGQSPTSLFALVTTAQAPASGAATYPIGTGVRSAEYKSLTAVAAEYCLFGYGTSIIDAETNRDAGQVIIKAGEIGSERIPELATHYSIKSASGTPIVQLSQKV